MEEEGNHRILCFIIISGKWLPIIMDKLFIKIHCQNSKLKLYIKKTGLFGAGTCGHFTRYQGKTKERS